MNTLFFLTKQKEGKFFTWYGLLWSVKGRVYVLQTAFPSYFHVVGDSWQYFLRFSVKNFATKICLVSASLVQCEDLSGSLPRFLLPKPVLSSLLAFPGIILSYTGCLLVSTMDCNLHRDFCVRLTIAVF